MRKRERKREKERKRLPVPRINLDNNQHIVELFWLFCFDRNGGESFVGGHTQLQKEGEKEKEN